MRRFIEVSWLRKKLISNLSENKFIKQNYLQQTVICCIIMMSYFHFYQHALGNCGNLGFIMISNDIVRIYNHLHCGHTFTIIFFRVISELNHRLIISIKTNIVIDKMLTFFVQVLNNFLTIYFKNRLLMI